MGTSASSYKQLQRSELKDEGNKESQENRDRQMRLKSLRIRENQLSEFLEDVDHALRSKLAPLLQELALNRLEQQRIGIASSELLQQHDLHPGAECLQWVDSLWFSGVCVVVICLNGSMMVMELRDTHPDDAFGYHLADDAFLIWYTVELLLRACLFGKSLLIGDVWKVWWNWLDLLVVVTGALEQWIVPLFVLLTSGRHRNRALSPLRILRFLRLCRLFRLLKLIKIFVSYDMHWVEDQPFQVFMIGIIGVNAITMGLELDIGWSGWVVVEELFLMIYCFEIFVRLVQNKLKFFYNESWKWNNLDFIIVASGVVDSWLSPSILFVQSLIVGKIVEQPSGGSFADFMKLFRLMRLLRVLRLVRLLRSIPPLFKLVSGIIKAAAGVQYVLLLAFVMLYATAIVFTTLIGKGLLWEHPPDAAQETFGSVLKSMFMLFKLMNDDQSVVTGVIDSPFVKLLFAAFMVISNWMVLAVLTSVVSDGMVHNTQLHAEEESERELVSYRASSCQRLKALFIDIQTRIAGGGDEGTGLYTITQDQFQAMLADESVFSEFSDAAGGLSKSDLFEMFILSCDRDANGLRSIDYVDFIDKLLNQDNGVVEKSIMRLESRQRANERTLEQVLAVVAKSSSLSAAELQDAHIAGITTALSSDLRDLSHDHLRASQGGID